MILVVAEFTIPLFAIIALNKFLTLDSHNKNNENFLKYSFYIVGGISLLFALFPTLFLDFLSEKDMIPISNSVKIPNGFLDSIVTDRSSLLISDAWRSFLFILISFGILMMFIKQKLKKQYVIVLIGLLIVSDMWNVNKRYLNDDNFVRKNKMKNPFIPTQADNFILSDNDPNFRVFNQSVSTFNDASTSYFHKSIGGYHGAKLKRYQELIEYQISKGNMQVLNMLNTKYFITPDGRPQLNPNALGNAWYIENVKIVENADEEILALSDFDPSITAIIDKRYITNIIDLEKTNKKSNIMLEVYKPNYLRYNSNNEREEIAVFSEIFYDKGWNAYIDGVKTDHFRVNYVLRALNIPKGIHKVEFKFEPKVYFVGENISLASSLVLFILLLVVLYNEFYRK
jgi:hypothetical protein